MTQSSAPASSPNSPDAAVAATEVFGLWQRGEQDAAFAHLAPYVGRSEPWALSLRVFLLMQQGVPGFESALEPVQRCVALGMPWVAAAYANNVIPHAGSAPNLVRPAVALLQGSGFWGGPGTFDPLTQGWNLLANSQSDAAIDLWSLQWPNVVDPESWTQLVSAAQDRVNALSGVAERARAIQTTVEDAAVAARQKIDAAQTETATKAGQVSILIDGLSDRTVNALYTRDADTSAREGKVSWLVGLSVLTAAVVVAVWPLIAHYSGHGPSYTTRSLLLAHAGPTVALGALAGVLLARARIRDHARQRSSDLATAMGTMIIYSEKIDDLGARQLFMQNMGRLILEAHLRTDGSTSAIPRDDIGGMVALANALKSPGA